MRLAALRSGGVCTYWTTVLRAACLVSILIGLVSGAKAQEVLESLDTARVEQAMATIASEAGIVYFYLSDCPYCLKQEPILRAFERAYGVEVLPVSLDGGPTLTGAWPNYRLDMGESVELDVRTTPTLFLAIPGRNEFYPITEGLLEWGDLEKRVLLAGLQAGLIEEEQLFQESTATSRAQNRDAQATAVNDLKGEF